VSSGASLIDSAAARRWGEVYDRTPEGFRWDAPAVDRAFLEAMQVCGVTVPSVRPKGYGSSMPTPGKDELDLWFERAQAEHDRLAEAREKNRTRFVPTIEQCSRAERAIWWLWHLREHPGPRRVYQVWSFCKATRNSFGRACRALSERGVPGWSCDRTIRRRRVDAALIIATALMQEGVPCPFEEIEPAAPPDTRPGWWHLVETMRRTIGAKSAERLIRDRVRDEFAGRSLTNAITYAEYKGRIAALTRRLEEETV
jgi:hypothetical protein